MTDAHGKEGSAASPRRPTTMTFRRRSRLTLPTPEQSRRQSDVVRVAWNHFGEPGPVTAFLNTRHDDLDGRPLHLAIDSDDGLARVVALLAQMSLEAQRDGKRAPAQKESRSQRAARTPGSGGD